MITSANVPNIPNWQNTSLNILKNEIWIQVKGYEDIYEISNLGRVKSLDRQIRCGKGYYRRKGIVLKQCVAKKTGYCVVNLLNKTHYVHRIVAMNFINKDNIEKLDVNHLDGDKCNNALSNLKWCTRQENIDHAIKMGFNRPSNLRKATISEDVAKEIIKIHKKTGFGKVLLQRHYFPDVSLSALQGITNNLSWKYLER